ncbi:hypothetical protein HKCCE4037_08275 [Rhodobacterales bacterium HKCCE4037]|nr:hypothetical protein [Rhodobacterales bacterium HKCCE4037]
MMGTDTDTFHFSRNLPLPPDRLWHLMTDAKAREAWGAPGEHTLDVMEADTRVGGIDRHRCGPADAPEFEVETRWMRLDGPHDAVFTEMVEMGGMALGVSLVTYHLAAEGSGTALSVTVAVSSFVGPEMMADFKAGWSGGLDNLERVARA